MFIDLFERLPWWRRLVTAIGLERRPARKYNRRMPQGYLTVQQAAERLEIHESRVKALIKAGKLKAERFGNRAWAIKETDLAEFELLRNRKAGRPRKD